MKAKSYKFLLLAAACMMAITSCNDDQDIQPSYANNTEQENVADSTQTANETNKGDESTPPVYIPLKKTANDYEPVVTPISSEEFTRYFSDGYWLENEKRYVYEDGTTSEPIREVGGGSTLFTQANGEAFIY